MRRYIFFVHGYGSNSKKAWGKFPEFLDQNPEVSHTIRFLSYTSPPWYKPHKVAPDLFTIAESLTTQLLDQCGDLEKDEIVLIGHSNGGVVIKKLFQRLEATNTKHNISRVCFLDVPHQGSGAANIGKVANPRNKHLKALRINSEDLRDLNDYWIRLESRQYIDVLNLVAEVPNYVASMSARAHYIDSVTIPGTDHKSVSKPKSSDDIVVREIAKFVLQSTRLTKYRNSVSRGYSDWLKFDRAHKLEYVEDGKRREAFQSLSEALEDDIALVRLTGLSGLGKSRLLIEYIQRNDIPEDQILIYDASRQFDLILQSLSLAVDESAEGLVVIEHCGVKLHNDLRKLLQRSDGRLKIVTVNFYHDVVDNSVHIKLEKLQPDKVGELLRSVLRDIDDNTVDRVTKFVEGFPLLVEWLTHKLNEDGALEVQLEERDFVEKLIDADGTLPDKQREVLKVLALFDSFQYVGETLEDKKRVEFFCKISDATRIDYDKTISRFSGRDILQCAGNFARLVPKPLALNLAMEWWNESLFPRQSELISEMPQELLESFCSQLTYLDSSPNVNEFVANFMDEARPFGQAELLLSSKGSQLFRALVEVNPSVTSETLARIFRSLSDDDVREIAADTRRNLVWSLEMLCWHRSYFSRSVHCLAKLACCENERFSNNSTGIFCQLFRWRNCGTEADYSQRLEVLKELISLDKPAVDHILVGAIGSAIETFGAGRMLGAEKQGTKPELEEWLPKTWDQVFSYWEQCLEILIELSQRPHTTDAAMAALGSEIRGLVRDGMLDTLDRIIRRLLELHGKYWPSAAQSISNALQFDGDTASESVRTALLSWQDLMKPGEENAEEQLLLRVLNPARDYQQDENGDLVDHATADVVQYAEQLSSLETMTPHLELILTFNEQKRSYAFGKALVSRFNIIEVKPFIDDLIREYRAVIERSRFEFVGGCLAGMYEADREHWWDTIQGFAKDPMLQRSFPNALRTGKIETKGLELALELTRKGAVNSNEIAQLSYGRGLDHLEEAQIVGFCENLSAIDDTFAWVALDVIAMYLHGRDQYDQQLINDFLKSLLVSVSFARDSKSRQHDGYHWQRCAEKLLAEGDQNFSARLLNFMLDQVAQHEVDYSDLWDVLHPTFITALGMATKETQSEILQRLIDFELGFPSFRLVEMLGSGRGSRHNKTSVFSVLDADTVVNLCSNERFLILVAKSLKLIEVEEEKPQVSDLLLELIRRYGTNEDFLSEVYANFYSRSWSGSLALNLEADKGVLLPLLSHESKEIRNWASEFLERMDRRIEEEKYLEQQEHFVRGW